MAISLKIDIPKANLPIRLFLCALLIFVAYNLSAQSRSALQLQKAYHHFLNFRLDSCRYYLDHSAHTDPFSYYLHSLLIATELFLNDDPADFEKRKYLESDLLEDVKKMNFTADYTIFLRSEIKLQWAVLKLKNGEELAAFWGFKQAYSLAKENINKNPEFIPSYKTLGLLHVLFGIFPEKYDWILTLFGIKGDVTTGLSELGRVWRSKQFLSLESGLTSALLHAYLLNNPERGAMMMKDYYQNHENLLTAYAYGLILMKNRQSEYALELINKTEKVYDPPLAIPQFYYLKGEIFLQKGIIENAIVNYQLFLDTHKGKNLIKDTYFKIGICQLIINNPDASSIYFEKSKRNGWAKNEADKYAQWSLVSEPVSDRRLYQLRYATDGGFYQQAVEIHEKIDTLQLTAHDRCEYYYRSARMFHYTENIPWAIANYLKAITSQGNQNWYFAPNSALQLGLIYSEGNDKGNAKKYLQLIKSYEDFPYENSIRQKAKAVISKLD